MTASDIEHRSVTVTNFMLIKLGKPIRLGDNDVSVSSENDGYLDLNADVGIRINENMAMASGKQFNGSADGVVNYTKAGTISDADFTTATTGLIAIDTSDDRLYYRIGAGDWSYLSADGGVSFPETTCSICGESFQLGEEVGWVIDGFAGDGAPHCIPVHRRCI